jgi:competence protein ComEA
VDIEEIDLKKKFDFEEFFQKHKWQVVVGGLGFFLLGVGIFSTVFLSLKNSTDSDIEIISNSKEEQKEIWVHVAGAVERPGLYHLDADARVNDALISAGGLSVEADRDWFEKTANLAQKLEDGAKLYIPAQGEYQFDQSDPGSNKVVGQQTSIFADSQGKINLNTASPDQLDSLPGIGPAYAQRIIDARPFTSLEQIKNIPGIGETTFEKIKDQICL